MVFPETIFRFKENKTIENLKWVFYWLSENKILKIIL